MVAEGTWETQNAPIGCSKDGDGDGYISVGGKCERNGVDRRIYSRPFMRTDVNVLLNFVGYGAKRRTRRRHPT